MTFADISQIGDDLIHTINQSLYHHSSVQRDEASIQNYPVIQLLDYLNDKKTLQRNDAVIGIIKSLHSLESNGMPKSCMDEVKGALKYQGLVNESFIESARRLANQAEPLEHNVDDERRKQVFREILPALYKQNPRPSVADRNYLSRVTGLGRKCLDTFFQNKRNRHGQTRKRISSGPSSNSETFQPDILYDVPDNGKKRKHDSMNEVNNTPNLNLTNMVLDSDNLVFPIHGSSENSILNFSEALDNDILSQSHCTNEYISPSSIGEQFNDTKYLLDFPEVVNIFNSIDDTFYESLFSTSLYPKMDVEGILLNA